MPEDILLSVCMITYNQECFIGKALDSILAQKVNFNYEIVVGEDLSRDKTRKIIEEYVSKNEFPIKLLPSNENHGVAKNFKRTIEACKGKYIAFLEGDDYWTDVNKLQKQVDFLEANPSYSICFHAVNIEKNGNILDDYITPKVNETTTQETLLKGNYIHTPSVVCRNPYIKLPDWFSTTMPADYPFYIIVSHRNKKIKFLDEKMAVYRVHDTGVWSMKKKEQYLYKIGMMYLNCNEYLHLRSKDMLRQALDALSAHIGIYGYKQISRIQYLYLLEKAIAKNAFALPALPRLFFPSFVGLLKKIKNKNDKEISKDK